MRPCRIDLLDAGAAKQSAEAIGMNPGFAELNIFRALLHRPKTAKALSELLVSLLLQGELDHRLRELLILRIGWATGSDYEWTQHWRIAQEQFACGEEDLLAVRDWRRSSLGADEKLVLEATDRLLETGDLPPELFARCLARLGRNASIELVTAVGCWQLVSKLTRALEIPLEEGIASWPPDGHTP
jgi:alkylhydroperoxidase family enzyme